LFTGKPQDGHGFRLLLTLVSMSEPELLRAMVDVGYFPPNTPRVQ
jgi:hypothetical protein